MKLSAFLSFIILAAHEMYTRQQKEVSGREEREQKRRTKTEGEGGERFRE